MRAATPPHRIAPALLLLAMVLGGAVCHAQSLQWWPEVDVSLSWKRTNVLIPSLTRLDSSLPNPQFAATGTLGTFSLNPRWSVSAGYLFADLPQHDQFAHLPLVALTPAWTIRHWSLSDINRFERLLAYSNEPYRYRNRVGADHAFGSRRTAHVYATDEIFFILSPGRSWNQNRAQLGAGIAANHSLRIDGYFLQRSAPGGKETSVFGTILTIMIKKDRPS